MGLFDKLTEHGIARKDGVIIKCMEDYTDGFQVGKSEPSGAFHIVHAIAHMAGTNSEVSLLVRIIISVYSLHNSPLTSVLHDSQVTS